MSRYFAALVLLSIVCLSQANTSRKISTGRGVNGEVQISVLRRGTQTRIPNSRVLNSDPALMRLRLVKKNTEKPRLSKTSKSSVAELLRLRMVKKSLKKLDTNPRTVATGNPTQLLRLRMVKRSKEVEIRKRLMRLFKILPVFTN